MASAFSSTSAETTNTGHSVETGFELVGRQLMAGLFAVYLRIIVFTVYLNPLYSLTQS